MDNFEAHGSDLMDIREQVKSFAFPSNCTSFGQPMDMGVVTSWKTLYRRTLLLEMMKNIELQTERRVNNIKKPAGMSGLAEGYDPHMLDVAHMCEEIWGLLTAEAMDRCWIKSNIFPEAYNSELQEKCGNVCIFVKEEISAMLGVFDNLSISDKIKLMIHSEIGTSLTVCGIYDWIEIEERDEVQEAVIEDALQNEGEEEKYSAFQHLFEGDAQDALKNNSDVNELDKEVVEPISPSSALVKCFTTLEKMCYRTNIPRAAELFRKARQVLDLERKRRHGLNSRQMMLNEI